MSQRRMFEIKCTDCGKTAMVPFKPTVGKPVYCSACFPKHMLKQRESAGTSLSFDSKQAWARRGDSWHGRKEEAPASAFQQRQRA
jgi:CxxC-x17-CxxC domain-containing protein